MKTVIFPIEDGASTVSFSKLSEESLRDKVVILEVKNQGFGLLSRENYGSGDYHFLCLNSLPTTGNKWNGQKTIKGTIKAQGASVKNGSRQVHIFDSWSDACCYMNRNKINN